MRHLRSLFDIDQNELLTILSIADDLKQRLKEGERPQLLTGHVLGLLFEKPSLRTRVSFQTGVAQLGGSSLFLGSDVGWGSREAPSEFTRVLGEYLDAVVCRAKFHNAVEELASFDALPVINGLTDLCHPCQAMADVLTIAEEFHDIQSRHLVFVGDGNNVARSLALIAAMLGIRFTLAGPAGYEIDDDWIKQITSRYPDAQLTQTTDAKAALADADVIYTDVWTSMGQEAEKEKRETDFAPYRVNRTLVAAAPKETIVMHCLPAVRGGEIDSDVIDGPQSRIIGQAGNRMHAQKALLLWLMRPDWCLENGQARWPA